LLKIINIADLSASAAGEPDSIHKTSNFAMMQSDFLRILEMGSERAVADLAVDALEKKPDSFPEVLTLCFMEKYPLSMRASRVVQLYCEKYPESIYPYLDEAIDKVLKSKIDGVKRNFVKIFSEFIDLDRISDPGGLLDACFNWLQDPGEKPALRIHSMALIFKLGHKEPELLHELKVILEMIDESSEISIRNCAAKMLKKLAVASRRSAVGSQ
jgi:hypothetical protein